MNKNKRKVKQINKKKLCTVKKQKLKDSINFTRYIWNSICDMRNFQIKFFLLILQSIEQDIICINWWTILVVVWLKYACKGSCNSNAC